MSVSWVILVLRKNLAIRFWCCTSGWFTKCLMFPVDDCNGKKDDAPWDGDGSDGCLKKLAPDIPFPFLVSLCCSSFERILPETNRQSVGWGMLCQSWSWVIYPFPQQVTGGVVPSIPFFENTAVLNFDRSFGCFSARKTAFKFKDNPFLTEAVDRNIPGFLWS